MAKTNWQDPGTNEIRSTHISGLQEAVGKIEKSVSMKAAFAVDIPLIEVFISNDDRYRIFQAPSGKRNWTTSSPVVVKKNGVVVDSGFEIDYGGGAIILNVNDVGDNSYTADAFHTTSVSNSNAVDIDDGKVYNISLKVENGNPKIELKEVL